MPSLSPFSFVGTVLTLISIILILLSQTGATSKHTIVSNHIRLVSIDTTQFTKGLAAAQGNSDDVGPFTAIYGPTNRDSSTSGGVNQGLRTGYAWGFYSVVATYNGIGSSPSYSTPNKVGFPFTPYTTLFNDLPIQYQGAWNSTVPQGTTLSDQYLGKFTHGAFYAVFLGSIFAGVTLIASFIPHRFGSLISSTAAFLGALLIAIGMAVYTIIYSHIVNRFNTILFGTRNVHLGLQVNYGNGLYIMWAAAGILFFASVPFFVSMCIGNRKARNGDY